MKKILIITGTVLCFSLSVFAQGDTADFKMNVEYGSKNPETKNILQFQNIDYYTTKIFGNNLKEKYFTLTCKEIWHGIIKKIDTLINTKSNSAFGKINNDTLTFIVVGSRVDDKLKLFFKFPKFGIHRKFDAIVTDDYSLRAIGTSLKIKSNQDFSAFAYILPYEQDGNQFYCAVAQNGKDIMNWGKKFDIKHYLVFDINFHD